MTLRADALRRGSLRHYLRDCGGDKTASQRQNQQCVQKLNYEQKKEEILLHHHKRA